MKLIKKFTSFIVVFVLLLTATFWILTQTIPPDRVKQLVIKELTNFTGQKIRIEGDLHWQLFPRPGIKINEIGVGEKQDPSSASIKHLLLDLRFTPLFRGRLIFNTINIDGLKLVIDKDAKRTRAIDKKTIQNNNSARSSHTKSKIQFAIDRLWITNGEVLLSEASKMVSFNNIQIEATHFNLENQSFPLKIKSHVSASLANHIFKTNFTFRGQAHLTESLFAQTQSEDEHSNIKGKINLQALQVDKLYIDEINANLTMRSNQLSLNPLHLTLYHGEAIGDLQFELNSATLTLNQTLNGIDMAELSQALVQKNLVTGRLDATIHTVASLKENNWMDSLVANGNLTVKEGSLKFVDADNIRNTLTTIIHTLTLQTNSQAEPPADMNMTPRATGDTPFQLLSITYNLHHQTCKDTFLLQADQLELKGHGSIDLSNSSIDNHVLAKISTNDMTVEKIQNILGGSFPLKLSGHLKAPLVLPDAAVINLNTSKYLLKKSLDAPVKELKKGFKSLLEKSLSKTEALAKKSKKLLS